MATTRETQTIDASGRILGRLAAEIAVLLRGKNKPDFVPYKDMGDFIVVKNVGKIKFSGKKFEQNKYFTHSDYLGSTRQTPLKKIFLEDPGEILRKAVYGMLPRNKLRAKMMKRLKTEK